MELNGERIIPAPVERTWAALNDPEVLKACIAGCEQFEPAGDNAYAALLAVRVGPVNARFKGNVRLNDIVPPASYTIAFDGQGGVAGFGKGSAQVALAAEGAAQTRLSYRVQAQVGGKIAQVGSRLVDAAAAKVAGDFFDAFEARLRSEGAGEAAPPPAVPAARALPAWLWLVGGAVVLLLLYLLMR